MTEPITDFNPQTAEAPTDEAVVDDAATGEAVVDAAPTDEVEETVEIVEVVEPADLAEADLIDVLDDEEDEEPAPREPSPYERPGDWFVVHTYAGYENKVKQNLASRVRS
ncbi:MAG: transcription termination/antitermination protein NusG, partial [Actinomycetota bacterium]|nr:transcription termination/antitermination protein NusG [Actinomycetota bacterium]